METSSIGGRRISNGNCMARGSNISEGNIDGANKSKFTTGFYSCSTIKVGVTKVNRGQCIVGGIVWLEDIHMCTEIRLTS
jgi:hypothetical protein